MFCLAANTEDVQQLVKDTFDVSSITILEEGEITAEKVEHHTICIHTPHAHTDAHETNPTFYVNTLFTNRLQKRCT